MSTKQNHPSGSGDRSDPLIDEVRDARRRLEAQHHQSVRDLAAALRVAQQASGRAIITGRPASAKRAG